MKKRFLSVYFLVLQRKGLWAGKLYGIQTALHPVDKEEVPALGVNSLYIIITKKMNQLFIHTGNGRLILCSNDKKQDHAL